MRPYGTPVRPDDVRDPVRRPSRAVAFAATGAACVVAGGLLAAVTAHAPTEGATWAVAYLVLVAGVGQVALGVGQAVLSARTLPPRLLTAELIAWNGGNAAVLAGTLLGIRPLLDAGSGLLVVALVLFAHHTRGGGGPQLLLLAYRALVGVVLVSIPIGLLLARSG